MFPTYVIEVGEEQAGLVVLEGRGFRFFAANPSLSSLEEQSFRTVDEATRAVRRSFRVRARRQPQRVFAPA
jgi:hypothetical protein